MTRHPVPKRLRWYVVLALLTVALPGLAFAQDGKLSGTVTDAETGDPIPGATVVLVDTQRGAATDSEGRYVIIGIEPDTYDVRISFVGFTAQVVRGVLVTSNRTKTLDVALTTEVIQGGEVVVEAEQPVVDQNQTNARALVTAEEIAKLPVADLDGVISRTSNSYEGFVRGSRRFETRTIVEGVDVSDAFYSLSSASSSSAPLRAYEGSSYGNANRASQTSASIVNLNPSSVQEVTVNSGATEPQYNAGSGGVVAVTLAEQRGPIRGTFSARYAPSLSRPGPDSLALYFDAENYFADAELVTDETKRALYTWTEDKYAIADDPEYDLRFSLGGSITDDWTFSTSGQWYESGGYLPNYSRKRLNGQLKTTYNITPQTQLTAVGIVDDNGLWGGWNNTDYVELWRFYLEGVAQQDGGSYVGSLRLRQVISNTSYVTVQAYRTYDRTRYGYVDDDGNGFQDIGEDGDFLDFFDPAIVDRYISTSADRDEVNDPKMFIDIVTDNDTETGLRLPDQRRYRLARPSPFSEDALSVVNGFKADYANQITFNHFLQGGAEFKARQFDYELVDGLPGPGSILNDAEEPFRFSQWERKPWELSFYASDRMQYAGLIVNVGARLNFINRDTEKIENFFYPFAQDSVLNAAGTYVDRNFIQRGDDVPIDVLFNPSVGISHPIGTTASMYFSYSRSQQLVPYSDLYRYYDGIHTTSQFFNIPDPEQDPITSNSYELGVQWEFLPGWGVDLNAYGRAIDNYSTTTYVARNATPEGEVAIVGFNQYTYVTNLGYADARGIELVVRRRPLQLAKDISLGVTASYTYSDVERSVTSGDNARDFSFDPDVGETTLPFDDAEDFENYAQSVRGGSTITGGFGRRHRGIIRAVADFPFDISVGVLSTIESGFEYERAIGGDARGRDLITAPTNFQIDFRLEKGIDFTDRLGMDFYLDVVNLTDRDNVVAFEDYTPNGSAIFQETGVPGSRLIRDDGVSIYGPARTVYFGSRLRF